MARKKTATAKVYTYQEISQATEHLSLEDLVSLLSEVERLINQKQREKRKELAKEMLVLAQDAGFASVEEFIGESKTRKTRSDKGVTFPPKYRDPSNPKKTWSGKGRKPNFVIKHLDGGGDLDDLLI